MHCRSKLPYISWGPSSTTPAMFSPNPLPWWPWHIAHAFFSFHLFSISLFSPFLYSFGFFVSPTFIVPFSPTFLSNTSLEFVTYQLDLFSSPLTQVSQLMSPLPPFFLYRYILAVSLLGCSSSFYVITFLVTLSMFWSSFLSIYNHSSTILQ